MGTELAGHVGRQLAARASTITRQWIDLLVRHLGEARAQVLPGATLLNHVPAIIQDLARFVGDPQIADPLRPATQADLGRLADLRRRRGTTLEEILREFGMLSALVEDAIAEGIASFEGKAGRKEIVRLVGRAKDAVFVLGSEAASHYRAWVVRRRAERLRVLEGYSAMLSHELGNRLGAAETAVRVLMGQLEVPPERRQRLHDLILHSVRSGLETVEAVSTLFRARDEASGGGARTLPLDVVLGDAVHQLRVRAGARQIRLELVGPVPSQLVDAERFPLVLYNLVTNAVRHHDRPGGRVRIAVEEEPHVLAIVVADDGPGIAEAMRGRIFEPRARGATEEEGAGLGLAIAREAAEQMGGAIELVPSTGRGSTFRLTIPCRLE